ncbi:MAG: hypothetical protein ACLGHY_01260, partial [Gammaproteobacteria bacterium]
MNFALILFLLLIVTFLAWVADRVVFRPQRSRAAATALAAFERDSAPRLRAASGEPAVAARLRALVAEYDPIELVLGLPRHLSGAEGSAAALV